jgi:hypothetical protein
MSPRLNIILLVISFILFFVGLGLAGYFHFQHHDQKSGNDSHIMYTVIFAILGVLGFLGIIILLVIRKRKNAPLELDKMDMPEESTKLMTPTQPPMNDPYAYIKNVPPTMYGYNPMVAKTPVYPGYAM